MVPTQAIYPNEVAAAAAVRPGRAARYLAGYGGRPARTGTLRLRQARRLDRAEPPERLRERAQRGGETGDGVQARTASCRARPHGTGYSHDVVSPAKAPPQARCRAAVTCPSMLCQRVLANTR
jgi:hypothetical protein